MSRSSRNSHSRKPSALLMPLLAAGLAIGCAIEGRTNQMQPIFTKADIQRSRPQPKLPPTTLTGTRLEQLLHFFPGAGTGQATGYGASGLTGLTIVLSQQDGRSVTIKVDMDMTSWDEGHGSHPLDPAFAQFITEIMSPPGTATTRTTP